MRAAVVGAGIGGLAAAVALRQAGHAAEVFERAPESSSIRVGGGLHLWPNGMRALQRLGLAERVEAVGRRIQRLDWYTPEHGRVTSADLAATARSIGAPSVGIRRADLLEVLLDEVGEGSIRFGAEVTAFREDEAGVTLRLAEGGEASADVLVVADGLRSQLRAEVIGDSDLRAPGVIVCQGTAPDAAAAPAVFSEVWDVRLRLGCYPVRDGTYWFAFLRAGDADSLGHDYREALLTRTEQWSAPGHAVVAETPATAIASAEVVARWPVERWSTGRVTLLGDAAHAMTPFSGQGACQALEDAVVLAGCLGAEREVATGLRRYETRRVPRTTEIWHRSWAAATAAARRDRSIRAGRRDTFPRTFERVVWKQLERTIREGF